jgi:Tfp pilus assembly protein PilO
MSRRDRIVVSVLAGAVAVAAFWFFGLAPKRKAIAAADGRIAAQEQRLEQAQTVLVGAQSAKRGYPAAYAAVARLGQAVPTDDNMASLVYQLQSVADGAKVKFRSIKLGGSSSSAASAATPATPSTATGTGTGTGTGTASGGASPSGSSTGTAAAPASQVAASALPPGAVVGTAGFATLPFSFVFEGSFLDMQRFLARVDSFVRVQGKDVKVSGRLLTVDGISLASGTDGATTVKATIAATAYLTPKDSAAGAATGATGAAGAAGATPSTATPPATASNSKTSSAVVTTPSS